MSAIYAGATSKSIDVLLRKTSDNTALTGIAYNTAGNIASYHRQGGSRVAITLATQTVTGAYSSGGFVEIDATNQPGLYRLDVPDAAFAAGADYVTITMVTTSGYVFHERFWLTADDLFSDYRSGVVRSGVAQSGGSTTTIKLDASASAIDDYYKNCLILTNIAAVSGTVSDMAWGYCVAYNGTTKVATVAGAWTNGGSPTTGDTFTIFAGAGGLTGADIADAIAARNYRGGANSSPTFADALAHGVMKIDITAGVLTVYHSDGSTVAFTRTLTRQQLNAIVNMT